MQTLKLSDVTAEMEEIKDHIDSILKIAVPAMPRSRAYAVSKDIPELHVFYWFLRDAYYVVPEPYFGQLKMYRSRFNKLNKMIQKGDV